MAKRNNKRSGFTLIEILIVVAIIAILASAVLVGLGPTQQAGRDARRLSDIREVQNALELFYSKCGFYPGGTAATGACSTGFSAPTTWGSLATLLTTTANIGVTTIPSDPSTNRSYEYAYNTGGTSYIIGAALENPNNSVFNGYTPPVTTGYTWTADTGMIVPDPGCVENKPAGSATYCLSL